MHMPNSNQYISVGLITVLCATIFIIDLIVPMDLAGGILYLIPVFIASQISGIKVVMSTTVICSGLIIIGLFLSPESTINRHETLERLLAFFIIWVSIWFLIQHNKGKQDLNQINTALLNAMPGISRLDTNGHFLYVNEAYASMLGYSPNELLGSSWESIIHEDDRSIALTAFQKAVAEGKVEFEMKVQCKDGSICYLQVLITNITDKNKNERKGLFCFIKDISERKQAEKLLWESNERLYSALSASHAGTWHVNFQTGDDTRDAMLNKLLGLPAESSTQPTEDWFSYVHTDDKKTVKLAWEQGLESGLYSVEHRLVRHDGQILWVYDRGQIFRDDEGQLQYGIGVVIDITEHKQTEEKLYQSEQRLRLHREQTSLGIIDWDTEFKIMDWNPAAEKIFGYSREEVIGKYTPRLITPENTGKNIIDIWKELIAGKGHEYHVSEKIITKDGRSIICEWYNTALVDADGKMIGITSTVEDISHKLEIEKQQLRSQKMEAIGKLAGGIAHDFNNLLGIIQSNFEFLQDFNIKDEQFQYWINTGLKTVQRGASLTRRLVNFSKIDTVDAEIVHVNNLILDLKELIERSLTPKIEVELNLGDNVWYANIVTDEFQDAMVNLTLNARDAMPNGGRLQITTSNREIDENDIQFYPDLKVGNYVVISVSDTGCGMEENKIERVFEPYFTTKRKYKGTGLGLSMVYSFTKRSQGAIKIYSEVGRGTTVRLYLPMLDRRKKERDEIKPEEKTIPGGTEMILAVDDEIDLLQSIKHLLESLGYQVLTAGNGHEALEVIRSHKGQIALLFSDVIMPGGMDGYQLAQQVEKIEPGIKILLASGFTNNFTSNSITSTSHLEVMEKPFTKIGLATKLRDLLDNA